MSAPSGGSGQLNGRLRARVTLQAPVLTPDGGGGYTRSWQDVTDLWAEVLPYSAVRGQLRKIADEHLQSYVLYQVTLRYRAGVTASMRLIYEDTPLDILSVTNVNGRNEQLELLARAGVEEN